MPCIAGLWPERKVNHFQVHTNLPVMRFIDMECPVGMDAYLLVLCRRTHFKLHLELSIKSHQSLSLYCQTSRRRTCSGSLQSVWRMVESQHSLSVAFLDSNKFFSFKRDATTSEDSLNKFKSLTRSLNPAWLKRYSSVHDESNSSSLISYSSELGLSVGDL